MSDKFKEIFKLAENMWKEYRINEIKGLDRLCAESLYSEVHNFYEFAKGFYFGYDQLTKENERLKKELMLEKAVVEKVTDLRPSRYSGEYEANDVNLVMGSARTRITERKEL